jgi:hypothetical protein
MKIQLDDPKLVSDLLSFLRAHGCLAYLTEDLNAVAAIRPHDFGDDEQREISMLVQIWRGNHPDAAITVVPS